VDASALLHELSPPLDARLAEQLIREFIDAERRYALGDWEPATLDGGQFAEVAARIVYHVDSGNVNRTKDLNSCLTYVEDHANSNPHSFPERRPALHLSKTIRMIYKLRSQRGAIHIDPNYTANELDAMFVMSTARWVMSEILRVFWQGSTAVVATAIREIVRFEVPAILNIDGRPMVMRTDCTAEEEVLLILLNSGEQGMNRTNLGKSIPKSAPAISNSLKDLCSPSRRQVAIRRDGTYVLTPNGVKRVRNEMSDKLTIS
jgi:hypothetical protein